jgi:hypothetical protein
MAGHGSKPLRGLESTGQSSISTGKFGRLFRWLPPAFTTKSTKDEADVEKMLETLASLMVSSEFSDNVDEAKKATPDSDINTPEEEDENRTIPAGYTYLGQFIDHDVTFDPASALQQQNDPDTLEDFRTPRLDLDCLYGRGPDDQPYLYAKPERLKFRLGPDRGVSGQDRPDVIRTDDDTALIGDKRNDENKIVRQIQALFLKFHNKVFDDLGKRPSLAADPQARFLEAQRIVRWSYQWIVLHDFLPKICKKDVVDSILPPKNGREPRFQFYRAKSGEGYIPVEFSVAAYRFGHSMVRPSYALNDVAKSTAKFTSKGGKTTPFARIPIFVPKSNAGTDAMNGFGEPLPAAWGIDWSFFFGQIPAATQGTKQIPQASYRIDATLVDPLGALPEFAPGLPKGSPFASLAFRNLERGFRMGLPSGQAVARTMGEDPLSDEELWTRKAEGDVAKPWSDGDAFFQANAKWIQGRAPLWFYLLKEAELKEKGHRLGVVGSRIVAETIVGLAWNDHFSYLFQVPHWDPSQEKIAGLDANLDMLKLAQYVG